MFEQTETLRFRWAHKNVVWSLSMFRNQSHNLHMWDMPTWKSCRRWNSKDYNYHVLLRLLPCEYCTISYTSHALLSIITMAQHQFSAIVWKSGLVGGLNSARSVEHKHVYSWWLQNNGADHLIYHLLISVVQVDTFEGQTSLLRSLGHANKSSCRDAGKSFSNIQERVQAPQLPCTLPNPLKERVCVSLFASDLRMWNNGI